MTILDERADALKAEVRGNARDFHVAVSFTDGEVHATCSCGKAGVCKHGAAVLLALMYRQTGVSYDPRFFPFVDEEDDLDDPGENRWTHDIDLLLSSASVKEQTPERPDGRLAYSLICSGRGRTIIALRCRGTGDALTYSAVKQLVPADRLRMSANDQRIMPHVFSGVGAYIEGDEVDELASEFHAATLQCTNEPGDTRWADTLALLAGKEVYLCGKRGAVDGTVSFSSTVLEFELRAMKQGQGYALVAELEGNNTHFGVPRDFVILCVEPLWIFMHGRAFRVTGANAEQFSALKRMTLPMKVPLRDRVYFLQSVLPRLTERFSVTLDLPDVRVLDVPPVPRVYLTESHGELLIELRFGYGDAEISYSSIDAQLHIAAVGEQLFSIRRQRLIEDGHKDVLLSLGLFPSVKAPHALQPRGNPLAWLATAMDDLRKKGFEVYGQEGLRRFKVRTGRPTLSLAVSSGIDWFDLNIQISFGGESVPLDSVVAAVKKEERFVQLADGSFGMLPDAWVKTFRRSLAIARREDESVRFSTMHVGLIQDLLDQADETTIDEAFERIRTRLDGFTGIETRVLPEGFSGELRPYQRSGYDWLLFLKEYGFGGILADDMGLGKTVQALVVLQKLYEDGATDPSLVVVPTSLLFNWEREAARFTPNLKTLCYHGNERLRSMNRFHELHLIITSYGIIRRDIQHLKNIRFLYVILDESQNIKNPISQNARAVRTIQADHRLALTGTPVENNLMELWSQFAFLNRGLLGGEHSFYENFVKPIERDGDEETAHLLRRTLHPFIMRRTKEMVATDLPPKQETTVMCDMVPSQRAMYLQWRDHYRSRILESIDTQGIGRSRLMVLEGLTRLRQICCHPRLVDHRYQESSGKLDAYADMLEDILAEGHKVLVFSQFVSMLSILRVECERKGISYEYLDGRTIDREKRVDRFQEDETIRLFLISLKAGGTGLNLTAADYVVHYDPWWNPAVEMQATDRTHRIGQIRHVFSYKLITRETIEEKIVLLQAKKRELVKNVIATDKGFVKSLTRSDVEDLFA